MSACGLDPMAREMFLEFLEGLTGQGRISCNGVPGKALATACCTDHWNESRGKIVMDGSCQEVLGRQQGRFRTIGLLGSEAAQSAELCGQTVCCRAAGGLPLLMRRCGGTRYRCVDWGKRENR